MALENLSSTSKTSENATPVTQEDRNPALDPDKIYWDKENEVFYHANGMYYDPEVKMFYTLIDQKGGDLRPIYYVQTGGDLFMAQKGKLGQSNSIVMEDKSWNKQEVYSIKSPLYKPGLIKMFKNRIKEGVAN